MMLNDIEKRMQAIRDTIKEAEYQFEAGLIKSSKFCFIINEAYTRLDQLTIEWRSARRKLHEATAPKPEQLLIL
jgi:hypothetical protein